MKINQNYFIIENGPFVDDRKSFLVVLVVLVMVVTTHVGKIVLIFQTVITGASFKQPWLAQP